MTKHEARTALNEHAFWGADAAVVVREMHQQDAFMILRSARQNLEKPSSISRKAFRRIR